jgi:hypothetical protein
MMIHHISIPANDPLHVSQVLAEVFDGKVGIFPPNPNSYMVVAGDEYGTLIEIYPSDSVVVRDREIVRPSSSRMLILQATVLFTLQFPCPLI